MAIQGGRALHSKRSRARDGEVEEVIEWQAPGDVYISSPSFFEHAVQYKQAYRWSKRCIAIQARLLFDQAEFVDLMKAESQEAGTYQWLGAFSRSLASTPVELPTLNEVRAVEAELAEQEAEVALSEDEANTGWKGPNGASPPESQCTVT